MKTEAAARVRAYLARHAKNRQGDPRAIHGYDLGEPSEAELLVADLKLLASPEAPAREGVDAIMSQLADIITEASVDYPAGRDAGHSIDYDEDAIRAVIEAALPPHCEAPAEPVSDHYKFDDEIAWLREAARYFSARDTKGEDRAHWANVYNAENARKLADRLAEAAGGEALGNLLAVIHGDGGHRALEVGTKQAALEAEKIVAGLFAAPSADKLREFGQHTNLELSYHYSEEGDNDGWQVHQVNGGVNDREWTLMGSGDTPADAIDQALAALSTPDALKGDAK